jgi:hypothetical protein
MELISTFAVLMFLTSFIYLIIGYNITQNEHKYVTKIKPNTEQIHNSDETDFHCKIK